MLTEKGSKRDFAMAGLLLGAGQRVGALGGLSHFVVTSVLRGRCYNLHLTRKLRSETPSDSLEVTQ